MQLLAPTMTTRVNDFNGLTFAQLKSFVTYKVYRVMLNNGNTVERFIEAPKGSASRPFTTDDHVARFKQEMLKRYALPQVETLLNEIGSFAQAGNPDRLLQLLNSRT